MLSQRKHSSRPRPPQRRGAAVVEMAFVMPVFVGIVLGIIEFGRGMMVGQVVTNAAREGARNAVIDGSTNATVESFIKTYLQNAVGPGGGSASVTITITPATGNQNPGNSLSNARSKDLIQVRVSVPFNQVSYIGGKYLKDHNLVGSCSMRHE